MLRAGLARLCVCFRPPMLIPLPSEAADRVFSSLDRRLQVESVEFSFQVKVCFPLRLVSAGLDGDSSRANTEIVHLRRRPETKW